MTDLIMLHGKFSHEYPEVVAARNLHHATLPPERPRFSFLAWHIWQFNKGKTYGT